MYVCIYAFMCMRTQAYVYVRTGTRCRRGGRRWTATRSLESGVITRLECENTPRVRAMTRLECMLDLGASTLRRRARTRLECVR